MDRERPLVEYIILVVVLIAFLIVAVRLAG